MLNLFTSAALIIRFFAPHQRTSATFVESIEGVVFVEVVAKQEVADVRLVKRNDVVTLDLANRSECFLFASLLRTHV